MQTAEAKPAVEAPAPAAAPQNDAPLGLDALLSEPPNPTEVNPAETVEAPEEATAEAPEAEEAKADAENPAEEAKPEEKAEVKLLAGEFKTPTELESAFLKQKERYTLSSEEGMRLGKVVKQMEEKMEAVNEQLEEANLKAELGSFKELTQEQYDALDTEAKLDYRDARLEFKAKQERMNSLKAVREAKEAQRTEEVKNDLEFMRRTPEKFPMFDKAEPIMEGLLDECPFLENSNDWRVGRLLYRAAMGVLSEQSQKESAVKQKQADESVQKKAQASAARSGASGAPGAVSSPTVTKPRNPARDPVNDEILNAGRRGL